MMGVQIARTVLPVTAFALALFVSAPAQAGSTTCTLAPVCGPDTACSPSAAEVEVTARDARVTFDGYGPIAMTRVRAGDPIDTVSLGDGELDLRATVDYTSFFTDTLSGAITRVDGDRVVLTVREIPRRYADYPGAVRMWRGECEELF